ncbi:LCP family protein [Ornithinimicrobium murale]|uniref:LCP family protein n=1 Tax=Ornithinimicrobium murale TaxID=1050153 RepID=UPI000E0D0B49|nr:LCP family protein [Ornithinimicrobium murale]
MTLTRRLLALIVAFCLAVTACSNGETDSPVETDSAPTTSDAAPTTSDAEATTVTAAPPPSPSPDTDEKTATAAPSDTEKKTAKPTKDKSDEDEKDDEDKKDAAKEALPDGTITALLIGSDSRSNDFSGRSDVIVLVQLTEDREHLNLVSIARDSYVNIPGQGTNKINEAYARGGIPLLRQTVSELMGGLEIDFVAQTNFDMFIALTRWMDGFYVDNEHYSTVTVGSTGRQVVFEEGRIKLENTDGLIYVRERKTLPLGDLDRTERHRAALKGMMERLVEIREEEPEKLLELLPMLHKNVKIEGDISVEQLMTMVDIGADFKDEDITSLMVPVAYFDMTSGGMSINRLNEGRTNELGQAMRDGGDLSGYVDKYGTSEELTGR